MRITRSGAAAGLLLVEAALGVLGVLVHYGLTAEYGDIADSPLEGLSGGFTSGVAGLALIVVLVVGLGAGAVSSRLWMRAVALVVPLLMVLGMLVVTPLALGRKRDVQYDAVPQCVPRGGGGNGPGARAARDSQEAFESIDHVGLFGGGGGSGVGGCDRTMVLTEDVDVLGHYREALPAAGWRIVEDESPQVRAERGTMAFQVVECQEGSVVWAGPANLPGGARCPEG